ncbi:hypothetical protein [uncultured Methanobrevibacter sp.]|uniref:hypothetical protein n=1 Tax=uncultured Methanobrevibacter sp. TaxID=253161 RepID=UPI0025DF43CE|nr:hypothetical protein [uncultured Methanobrevibacter sp.]
MIIGYVLAILFPLLFLWPHQNNVARVRGHLKNKQELIEGFRQKLDDFEINKLKYWIFH